MRTFSQGLPAQIVARALAVLFLWSACLTGLVSVPADAQIVTRTAIPESVAVVPFENLSAHRPATFGDEASEAVAVELRDRLLLDVYPKADVSLMMRDLGLIPPLADVELIRLATELEVTRVVTGQVRRAGIVGSGEGRYGEVELAVRLFDRVAQADVNGALATGRGPATPEASDDELVRKALEQAAFSAIQKMRTRPSITAMVLWSQDDTVFLNVGSRGGLRPGVKLVAIRSGQRIGLVEITEADAIGSYGKVAEGPPLRSGDHLRAIFDLGFEVSAPAKAKVERRKSRLGGLVLAAAALFGLADIGSTSQLLKEGEEVAAFTASNLANGLALTYSTAGLFFAQGSTLITWDPYSGTERRRIIAYEIIRDPGGTIVDFVDVQAAGQYFTFDYNRGFGYWEATISADSVSGQVVSRSRAWIVPEDELPDPGIFQSGNDVTAIWYQFGPAPGQAYVYRVRPWVLIRQRSSEGIYVWTLTQETEYSSTRNRVVSVPPPIADSVSVNGMMATFDFYHPVGAEDAIIQVARDPYGDFPPHQTHSVIIQGLWTIDPSFYSLRTSPQVDLAQVPGTDGTLWWRVGARSRLSRSKPRPWPTELTNDNGWVWSDRQTFSLTSLASRESLVHSSRELLARERGKRVRVPRDRTTDRVLHAH